MCFNATASMGAFLVGLISLGFILQRKMYAFGMFYTSVFAMQLAEYFAHISLDTHDKQLNKWSATSAMIITYIQPVLWALYNATYVVQDQYVSNIIYVAVAMFTLFALFFYNYINERNGMKIGKLLPNCSSSFCRLDWSFFRENTLLSVVWLCFYFFLFLYTNLAIRTGPYSVFSVLPVLLGMSIVYMIVVDKIKDIQSMVSGFGSIWCIAAVSVGPIVLAYPSISR